MSSESFRRWVEYYKWTGMEGITWPEWKEAYDLGIIR